MSPISSAQNAGFMPKLLASLLGLGIILLAAANGFFTYSGALLYIEGQEYALLFAGAVQFAIAMSLLALPFVRGLGKPVLVMVYSCALVLSTLTAYTYIYNASLPGDISDAHINTNQQSALATAMSDAIKQEREQLDQQFQQMEQLHRTTEEEAIRGLNSGLGPGRGKEYYRKLEEYEALKVRHSQESERVAEAEVLFRQFTGTLGNDVQSVTPEAALAAMTAFSSQIKLPTATETIKSAIGNHLGKQPTALERAVDSLKGIRNYDTQTIVSLVWASVFDLLALFLGVIRYNLIYVTRPVLNRIYEGALGVATFGQRLKHLNEDAKHRYREQQNTRSLPLNSTDMQNFATQLLAGSQLSVAQDSEDSSEPIRRVIQYLEPLYSEKQQNLVGIPWDTIVTEQRLAPLVSMLVQNRVLLNDVKQEAYLLNSSTESSQKVLVLMRLGMTEPPESMAGVDFLMGEKPSALTASRV